MLASIVGYNWKHRRNYAISTSIYFKKNSLIVYDFGNGLHGTVTN